MSRTSSSVGLALLLGACGGDAPPRPPDAAPAPAPRRVVVAPDAAPPAPTPAPPDAAPPAAPIRIAGLEVRDGDRTTLEDRSRNTYVFSTPAGPSEIVVVEENRLHETIVEAHAGIPTRVDLEYEVARRTEERGGHAIDIPVPVHGQRYRVGVGAQGFDAQRADGAPLTEDERRRLTDEHVYWIGQRSGVEEVISGRDWPAGARLDLSDDDLRRVERDLPGGSRLDAAAVRVAAIGGSIVMVELSVAFGTEEPGRGQLDTEMAATMTIDRLTGRIHHVAYRGTFRGTLDGVPTRGTIDGSERRTY